MPLPMMAGDPATMLTQPGMQAPAGPPPGAMGGEPTPATVDPREQARGAVQAMSQFRTTAQQTFEALATQFPPIAQSAQAMLKGIDASIEGMVKQLLQTSQMPEPTGPAVVR